MPSDPLLELEGRDPAAVAFVDGEGRPCTLGDLRTTRQRAHAALSPWIEATGGPLCVQSLLPDEPSSALAVLALASRTVVAPTNPALTPSELAERSRRLRPALALVRGDRADDLARVEVLGVPTVRLLPRSDSHCADFDLLPPETPPTEAPAEGRAGLTSGLVLSTSGSTGSPKLVPLGCEQMRRSADNIARWLRLAPSDRALHMLPLFHVGAFVDLMLAPLRAGGSVHFGHPVTTERLVAAIREERATWIQLVPTMLHRLLAEDDEALADAASRLRFVRTVSADLAPVLQERARALFGDVPIIQMYGMTETAGQITSNPLPPEASRPGSVGRPAGPELRIMDALANPRAPGEVGEVCVAGPSVMAGYLDHEADDVFHGRWFRTGDLGVLDEDGFLTLTGRRKQMINRGGEKIAPVEIERALLTHPGVVEAAALGVPHPTLGEEPVAAVVSAPGAPPTPEAMMDHAGAFLADFKRPRRIVLVDALPRLGSGKIDRVRLRDLVRGAPRDVPRSAPAARSHDDAAARTPVGRTLSRLWVETLGCAPPRPDSDFFDDGGDSLAATSFVVAVEKALSVTLPANTLYESPTFERLVRSVSTVPREQPTADPLIRAVQRATAGWAGVRAGPHDLLVGRRTMGRETPFFFVSPGLAGAEDLVSAFHPERPIWVMRTLSKLRGRFRRRLKTEANNRRLAEAYRDGIREVQPVGPVLLGGFCQGADVARLVADELRRAGHRVAVLGVIDRLFTDPVRGRAAIVWTAGSEHSADTQFDEPEKHLPLLYPDGCSVLHLPERHTEALRGRAAERIADFFEREFARALSSEAAPRHVPAACPEASAEALARRRAAHSARIRLWSPRLAVPGRPLAVRARVTNTSAATWNGPAGDGLRLCARWLNLDGHVRTERSGEARLPGVVRPGETVSLELSVPFPERRLPMLLMVDMVDDGLNWFHRVGSRPAYRVVWPDPVRGRTGSASSQR